MKMLRGIGKGVGGSAVEGVAGVVAFYTHRMLSTRVAFVQNHPLAAPGGILVLGHMLKKSRKLNGIGTALCGIAGYAGAQVFELQKATKATQPAQTSGFDDDTGALTQAADIGALTLPENIGSMDGSMDTTANAYEDAMNLGL